MSISHAKFKDQQNFGRRRSDQRRRPLLLPSYQLPPILRKSAVSHLVTGNMKAEEEMVKGKDTKAN
jgi:hypothetical protein